MVAAGEPVVDLYSPEVFAAQGELAAAVKLGDQPIIRALTERFERWNLASGRTSDSRRRRARRYHYDHKSVRRPRGPRAGGRNRSDGDAAAASRTGSHG